jgi:hypothetical protein
MGKKKMRKEVVRRMETREGTMNKIEKNTH